MNGVCEICNGTSKSNTIDKHHLNYKENITMVVCRVCHAKIHRKHFDELKPVDLPPKKGTGREILFNLDNGLHADLKIKAIKQGIPMREAVIEAIKEWVAKK